MTSVFGEAYSSYYDTLYGEKDYAAECDLIEALIGTYGGGGRNLLDLGCGTGNHLLPLARRGFDCTGVDLSAAMLAAARDKAGQAGLDDRIALIQSDVRAIDIGKRFDTALMMFAVLGYLHRSEDVVAALTAIRRHLNEGSVFIFDVWYGPAVTWQRPSQRVKTIPMANGKLVRISSGALDSLRQLCTVDLHLMHIEGERLLAETAESHTLRYFFPQELEYMLSLAGFRLETLRSMDDFAKQPDESSWNVIGAARAV